MSLKKRFAFFGAAALGAAAFVLGYFPQTVGLAPAVKAGSELAHRAAANIPDECPAALCPDASRGAIRPLDGGVRGICECP